MDRLLIKIGGNWHYKIFGRIVLGSKLIFFGAVLPKYMMFSSKQFPPNFETRILRYIAVCPTNTCRAYEDVGACHLEIQNCRAN